MWLQNIKCEMFGRVDNEKYILIEFMSTRLTITQVVLDRGHVCRLRRWILTEAN